MHAFGGKQVSWLMIDKCGATVDRPALLHRHGSFQADRDIPATSKPAGAPAGFENQSVG
jgi:hypothetical protein